MTDGLQGAEYISDYVGVPVATLYQWRHRGIGPRSYRIGRHIKYRLSEVDEWIEAQADRHPEPAPAA